MVGVARDDPEEPGPEEECECADCLEVFKNAKALNLHRVVKHNYRTEEEAQRGQEPIPMDITRLSLRPFNFRR